VIESEGADQRELALLLDRRLASANGMALGRVRRRRRRVQAPDVARLFKAVDTALEGSTFCSTNAGVFRFGAFAGIIEESFHVSTIVGPTRWQERCFTHLQRAIETLTKWLALALAPLRIRVNAIAPGHPETEGNIAAGL